MGLRFRKRIGFGPFKINLSGSGISLSAGVRGASVNIPIVGRRKRKPSVSVGVPGTGLYYTQTIGGSSVPPPLAVTADNERNRLIKLAFDKAAAGQPTEVREIMACALLAWQQHHEDGDLAVQNAILQAFPHLTEARLNEIMFPLAAAVRDVGEQQRSVERQALFGGFVVGAVIVICLFILVFRHGG